MRTRQLWLLTAAIIASGLGCGQAQAAADCPPLGSLPNYFASDPPDTRGFGTVDFTVQKGDETTTVTVAGRSCTQAYHIKAGTPPLTDLEIQSNYRSQMKRLGAQILFTDDRNTVAKLDKGGQETWLSVASNENEIDTSVVVKAPFKPTLLAPSGKDYRLVGHMPNYLADEPEKRNFDQLSFTVQSVDDTKEIKVQGAKYVVAYRLKPGTQPTSDIEIAENYRAALKALGGEILFADGRNTVARLLNNGQTIWVQVASNENEIDVSVIEEKAFEASIKPPEASALKAALDKDGHVALYINFDFGKATLRPDAAPVIAQVVKLLKDAPTLTLEIDGHTDNVGGHDYNVKLSDARAAAVVAAVAAQGIGRDRLKSAGFGPDKPIADNNTTDGRAKNRRVELVKT